MLALGGNAMTNADGRARPEDQIAAAEVAMAAVAELLEQEVDVVVTHGNGPQVGNLLVKNELAAAVVPPVPLDWCGAQTQATLGFVLMDALDAALARRGLDRRTATVVTRTLVSADDAGFVVIANGGGGIPVVRDADGALNGVEAVIDKDLGAALLARTVGADVLVIGTDVAHAVLHYGTPEARDVGVVTAAELRAYA